jgi:hypothetical protein
MEVSICAIVQFNEEELVHMHAMEVIEQLKVYPKKLLGKCLLVIAGGSTSGRMLAYLGRYDPYIPEEANKFRIQVGAPGSDDALPFEVYNVRMIPKTEQINLAAIPVNDKGGCHTTASGPDFMITGQLTGCAFAILKNGTDLRCTHVQPGTANGHLDAVPLKKELEKNGHFLGARDMKFTRDFGRPEYGACAYVIGIRRKGKWEVYAQHASSQIGKDARIEKVTQIV